MAELKRFVMILCAACPHMAGLLAPCIALPRAALPVQTSALQPICWNCACQICRLKAELNCE